MDPSFWSDMTLPWILIPQKILRPIMVYLFLVVVLRLAGKRELGQLNTLDLVVLLLISNTVQNAIIGNEYSPLGGLLGAATLLVVNWLVVRWTYHHPRVEQLVEGTPTVLIEGGLVKPDALAKEFVTIDELRTAAHRQGLLSLDDAERVVLETSGALTFVPKAETTRVRRHDELVARLDAIQRQLTALSDGLRARGGRA